MNTPGHGEVAPAASRIDPGGRSPEGRRAEGETHREDFEVTTTSSLEDKEWDAFLGSIPLADFQQFSGWAEAKSAEGWTVVRVVIRQGEEIQGGFQLLWRTSRVGRLGYVSHGPVLPGQGERASRRMVELLKETAADLSLVALIAQPPRTGREVERQLDEMGFLPNRVYRIITATWITPVTEGMAAVEAGMRRSTRRTLRQARKRGVTVQKAGADDLEIFFELMAESCRRQGTSPNPASIERLGDLWRAFGDGGLCRLTLAVHEGRPVAGLFCLCCGARVHVWKKGTLAEALPLHPMELLYHDALQWAEREGYEACDFEAASRETAEALLDGQPLTDEMIKSRDFYNIGFGGHPELLPEARLWIRNPFLRQIYRLTACAPAGSRLLRHYYEC